MLSRIGAELFEAVSADLFRELLKSPARDFRPGVYVGRELTFSETIMWPSVLGGELWDGMTVFSAIYLNKADDYAPALTYLLRHIEQTLSLELSARKNRVIKRPGSPSYFVFLTNASVLDAAGQPGLSEIKKLVGKYSADLNIRNWKLLHRQSYFEMLDLASKTRKTYAAHIAPADILNQLAEYRIGVTKELADSIKIQVAGEFLAEQWIRLSQAGDDMQSKLALSSVGIDLPLEGEQLTAANYVIAAADRMTHMRKSGSAPNVLMLGGPGQGKSTITQMICQCYRVSLLSDSVRPGQDTSVLVEAFRAGFSLNSIPLPKVRRWPIKIELGNYVDAAVGPQPTTLVKYIAEKLEKRVPDAFDPAKVRSWLRAWPWLVVLDGLDEVASARGRDVLMEQISQFSGEVEAAEADVFILSTSRPQGYAGEFTPDKYKRATLAPLAPAEAITYGSRLADNRHGDDPDFREKVVERITTAAAQPFTARLMRSPLQVTIMSILLEAHERAPRARYELFDKYYDTIYAREISKPGPLARLLEKRRKDVDALHNWLGLMLQANSERAGDSDAAIPQTDLKEAAVARLQHAGYDSEQAHNLAKQILEAVTGRLVLIVPKNVEDVGFEVRSIQEFMAARSIVSGSDAKVLQRFDLMIEPAHWRNTWLFAAGKASLERDHIRPSIVNLLSQKNLSDPMSMSILPGADLALDLLEDDVAVESPRIQRVLYRQALELLRCPPDEDLRRRAHVFVKLAEQDTVMALSAEQAIDQAIAGSPAQLESARILLEAWSLRANKVASRFRQRSRDLESSIRQHSKNASTGQTPTVYEIIIEAIESGSLSSEEKQLGRRLANHFKQSTSKTTSPTVRRDLLESCLRHESLTRVLAEASITSSRITWSGANELRDLLRNWVQRKAVGIEMIGLTPLIIEEPPELSV